MLMVSGCGDGGALGQVDFAADCGGEELLCALVGLDAPLAQGAQTELSLSSSFAGQRGGFRSCFSPGPLRFFGSRVEPSWGWSLASPRCWR